MNSNEYAKAHAEHARQVTESWHRLAAGPTLEAQARARQTEEQAKSTARQQSIDSYRAQRPLDHYQGLRKGDAA